MPLLACIHLIQKFYGINLQTYTILGEVATEGKAWSCGLEQTDYKLLFPAVYLIMEGHLVTWWAVEKARIWNTRKVLRNVCGQLWTSPQ